MLTVQMLLKKEFDQKVLLIVDDDRQVARAAKRAISPSFDAVLSTTDPHAATRILEQKKVSHVLCDLNLGLDVHGALNGFAFASLWRSAFPHLEKIVIFTGEDVCDLTIPLDVDAVLPKSASIDRIAETLLK